MFLILRNLLCLNVVCPVGKNVHVPRDSKVSTFALSTVIWLLMVELAYQAQLILCKSLQVVLDGGRVDKIRVSHDILSENAQVAITDYKVIGPAYHGESAEG